MEIEVLGICGSPFKDGNTEVFLRESLKAAEAVGGVKTHLLSLAGKEIKDCKQCNWCVKKQEEDKFCVQEDDMAEIYPEMLKADALLLASPVYFGRLSGYLACFIDRLRVFVHGNAYRGGLRNKTASALTVAWGRNTGGETTLFSVVSSLLMLEMLPVGPPHGSGSTFGAVGLASENGTGKFDRDFKLGVLRDEFGLKGARSLGKRIAEVTKIIKAGETELNHLS